MAIFSMKKRQKIDGIDRNEEFYMNGTEEHIGTMQVRRPFERENVIYDAAHCLRKRRTFPIDASLE